MSSDNQPAKFLSDIAPPRSTAQSAPELVESIPVKTPDSTQNRPNPISSPHHVSIDGVSAAADKTRLDNDLKQASQDVSKPDTKSRPRFSPKPKQQIKKDRRIAHFLPVLAAFIIAGLLSAAAVYAYQQSNRRPKSVNGLSPSAAAQEGSVISVDGLENYFQSLSNGINGLNDDDFGPDEMSDSSLGL